MAAIYARWILAEKITIDDVPERWKQQVLDLLTPSQETLINQ